MECEGPCRVPVPDVVSEWLWFSCPPTVRRRGDCVGAAAGLTMFNAPVLNSLVAMLSLNCSLIEPLVT